MNINDLKDYILVWSEEFEGNQLDSTKWNLREDNAPTRNLDNGITFDYTDEEKVVKVDNGKLVLNCYYDEKRDCFIGPKSVQTKKSMSFKYGYLEIRARMPYTHGALPTIKAYAKNAINSEENAPYYSVLNLVAITGISHYAYNNISKMYENYDENNPYYEKSRKNDDTSTTAQVWGLATPDTIHSNYTDNVLDDYKTYGFLWTPEKMIFTINGRRITQINLTQDFLRPSGMDGFHKPHYLEFSNYLNVDNEMYYHLRPNRVTLEDVETQIPFEVDYVRLYQKEGEGELNIN